MSPTEEVVLRILRQISDLAEEQVGQITKAQLAAIDPGYFSDYLVKVGVLESVNDGVLRLRGGARPAFPQLHAAWLLLEPQTPAADRELPASGVISHHTALRLYRIGDRPGPGIEFTAAVRSPDAVIEGVEPVIHIGKLHDAEWRYVEGIPTTSPGRTLADVAAAGALDIADLGRVAAGFLREGVASKEELVEGLERSLHRQGTAGSGSLWLETLLGAADTGDLADQTGGGGN